MQPINVSRETLQRLTVYHDLLQKWSPRINLVSKSSLSDIWARHIWDSAQIMMLKSQGNLWMDIGSGGGFPGLVVSICAQETDPARHVIMVESDQRKAAFLRTVIRELALNADVFVARVEDIDPINADVLTARALADLDTLLAHAERHLSKTGVAYFLKGEKWQIEVEKARESWSFDVRAHTSITNRLAAVLEVKDIERV